MLRVVVWVLGVVAVLVPVGGRVDKDERRRLESGTARAFLGVVVGESSLISQAIEEGASLVSPLDSYIAESILRLGNPYVDYPICPPIHLAFNYGLREHLNIASYLTRQGVDVNDFRLPAHPRSYFDRGYAPALLYALGFGQTPNNSHAAFIQRYHRTFPSRFDFRKIESWRVQTDNPPLLHIAVALDNFDGAYVLLAELTMAVSVHSVDQFNMTALHYAAWFGQIQAAIFLLYNGAVVSARDRGGYTALHLAIMRNQMDVAALLLGSITHDASSSPSAAGMARKRFLSLVQTRNLQGDSALDLMLLRPIHRPALRLVQHFAAELNLSMEADVATSAHQGMMLEHLFGLFSGVEADSLWAQVDEVTSLSIEAFRARYFIPQRPVLVADDSIASGMGVWAYLDDPREFVDRYGRLPSIDGKRLLGNAVEEDVPGPWASLSALRGSEQIDDSRSFVADFLDDLPGEHCGSERAITVATISYAEFAAQFSVDFAVPDVFTLCGDDESDESFTLTVGPARSAGHLVQQAASYHVLLRGRKVWMLMRPGYTSNHTLLGELESKIGVNRSYWGLLPGRLAARELLPQLALHDLAFLVQQRVGEVLFLPADWIRLEINLEDSIGLSHAVCKRVVTDARVPPIGYSFYGEEDAFRGLGFPKTHFKSNYHPGIQYSNRKKPPVFESSIE